MKYSHLGDHHAMIPIKDRQTKSQRFEYGRTSYFKGIRSWYQTGIQTWTHSDSHNTKTLAQEDFFHPWAIQIRSSFFSKVSVIYFFFFQNSPFFKKILSNSSKILWIIFLFFTIAALINHSITLLLERILSVIIQPRPELLLLLCIKLWTI